jgi:hypothetical protein
MPDFVPVQPESYVYAPSLTTAELVRIAYTQMLEDELRGDPWSGIQLELLKRLEARTR